MIQKQLTESIHYTLMSDRHYLDTKRWYFSAGPPFGRAHTDRRKWEIRAKRRSDGMLITLEGPIESYDPVVNRYPDIFKTAMLGRRKLPRFTWNMNIATPAGKRIDLCCHAFKLFVTWLGSEINEDMA